MQWMQTRRPLSTLSQGLTILFFCLTALPSQAAIQPATNGQPALLNLPPITISKKMLSHSATTHGNVPANQHAWSAHHNSAGKPAPLQENLHNQRQVQYGHHFRDPLPGAQQHSVKYIEPPEPLKRLPTSTVLETKQLPLRFEMAQVYRLPPFRAIVARGDINITLRNTENPRVAIMNLAEPGRDMVNATVKNGTLYLIETPRPPVARKTPLQVLVDANNIQLIRLYDKSSLNANHYHSHRFNIVSATSGNILLHTQVDVNHIEQLGTGMISIDWIKGDNLDIFTRGPGLIRLAGSVNSLNIRAIGHGKVDAKYVRTENALVQTAHHAEVAVRPHLSLNGFASHNSYIYYYKTPDFITPRTSGSGNIIQMRYWD